MSGLDFEGLAQLAEARAKRYAPIYNQPELSACVRLLHRNPVIAPIIRRAIEDAMKELPGGGVGLDVPLFPPGGEPPAMAAG